MLQSFAKMDDYTVLVAINGQFEKLTFAEAKELQEGVVPTFFLRKGNKVERLEDVPYPLVPGTIVPAYKISF